MTNSQRRKILGQYVLACVKAEPKTFAALIVLMVTAALSEGYGVSLLAPLLDTGTATDTSMFTTIPLVDWTAQQFDSISDPTVRIMMIAGVMALVSLLRGATQFLAGAISVAMPLRLLRRSSTRSYADILSAWFPFVGQRERGDLIAAVIAYPTRASEAMRDLAVVTSNMLVFLVYIVLMVSISWKLMVAAFIFVLLMSMALRRIFDKIISRAGQRLSDAQARLQTHVQEMLSGIRLIHLARGETRVAAQFADTLDQMVAAQRRAMVLQEVPNPFFSTMSALFICTILAGGAMIERGMGNAWVSNLLLFLFLLFRLNVPVSTTMGLRTRIVANMDAIARLETFHQAAADDRQPTGGAPIARLEHGIQFSNVSYTYAGGKRPAVENMNFTIGRGEMVAIVGPSGSGKSTIVGLITRLFDPTTGQISVDGSDLRGMSISEWRSRVATVSQDVFIFDDTVTSNLCFPQPSAPAETIRDAVSLALAGEFIEELPQGYETRLGDRGLRLSGGQQQRIAIARAVIAKPDLLILDEATSQLDSITETAIQRALDSLSHRLTIVVIAHRLSTVRKADRIIVLRDGRIVEQGTHAELTRTRGTYFELLSHQMLDVHEEGSGSRAGQNS